MPAPRRPESTPRPLGPVVPFEDLERLEDWLSDSYESAWALAEAGHVDFDHLAEPIVWSLRLVRTILAENAA